jgi:hypothetical protein
MKEELTGMSSMKSARKLSPSNSGLGFNGV